MPGYDPGWYCFCTPVGARCSDGGQSEQFYYLRKATVSASGELAQGQMTSGLRPLDWKTLRKASQEDMDPVEVIAAQQENGGTVQRGWSPATSTLGRAARQAVGTSTAHTDA